MPDLETQITGWRQIMSRATGAREKVLDELEEHLREEVARLVGAGTSLDEAFAMASKKLGTPSDVVAEFNKLTAAPAVWMPVRIARMFAASTAAALVAAAAIVSQRRGILLASHNWCVTLGYVLMFIMGGVGICQVCAHWLGEPSAPQKKSLIGAMIQFANVSALLTGVGVLLGMFWAKENWGRYWAWDPKETGAFLVLSWAILISAIGWVKRRASTIAIIAILGNVVTAWGWFGANGKSSGLSYNVIVVSFAISQVLFALAGVVYSLARAKREQTRV